MCIIFCKNINIFVLGEHYLKEKERRANALSHISNKATDKYVPERTVVKAQVKVKRDRINNMNMVEEN